jgi:hypothetical protein
MIDQSSLLSVEKHIDAIYDRSSLNIGWPHTSEFSIGPCTIRPIFDVAQCSCNCVQLSSHTVCMRDSETNSTEKGTSTFCVQRSIATGSMRPRKPYDVLHGTPFINYGEEFWAPPCGQAYPVVSSVASFIIWHFELNSMVGLVT